MPGSKVEGSILWALTESPGEIRISLGWWTEGRGNKDTKIEDEVAWETTDIAGERRFSFTLPASPYSFEGTLISLKWGLELTARRPSNKHLRDIIVSPLGAPVQLGKVDDEGFGKSIPLFGNR